MKTPSTIPAALAAVALVAAVALLTSCGTSGQPSNGASQPEAPSGNGMAVPNPTAPANAVRGAVNAANERTGDLEDQQPGGTQEP